MRLRIYKIKTMMNEELETSYTKKVYKE